MSKQSKTNRKPKVTPQSSSRRKTGNKQTLLIRIVIGIASVATIVFGLQVFFDSNTATPIVSVTSPPTSTANDGPASTGNQPAPTINVGAVVPAAFVGMNRTSYTQGVQALTDINKLHDATISFSGGFSAVYTNTFPSLTVSVWVGVAANSTEAATLVKQMNDFIVKGGTSFSNPQTVTVAGQTVYQVQGPGGTNYFYQSNIYPTNVVWLTIQAPDAAQSNSLLQSALQTF